MTKDKILHFSISAVLVIVGMLLLRGTELCLAVPLIVLALGIGKEVFDYIRKKDSVPYCDLKDQCIKDFFADFFGVIAGTLIASLIVIIL